MKQKILCILLILGTGALAHAQDYTQSDKFLKANSNWVFGDSAGINFNVSLPVGVIHHSTGYKGSAAASHPETGALLFYANGAKCWKADGSLMAHGDSLLGNTGYTHQGVCIVPFINDTNRYYLFSLSTAGTLDALYYSVVDRSLDNGEGDIDTTKKNTLLHNTSLSNAMVAIPGECNDVWLLLHSIAAPEFIAYHITAEGIDTTPVVSTLGSPVVGVGSPTYSRLAVSPDRQKIAINGESLIDHVTFVAEFDPLTAAVTNQIEIMGITPYRVPPFQYAAEPGYGMCFSPDNTKLYVATSVIGNPFMTDPKHRLYQFDISNFDSTAIVSSRYSVYATNTIEYSRRPDLRTYRDSIYICIGQSTAPPERIDRINQPNMAGAGCSYETDVISLAPGSHNQNTFGSDVVYPMPADTIAQHLPSADTAVCAGGSVLLTAPAGYLEYLWSNGSTDTVLQVMAAGNYWVSYRDVCYDLKIDTFSVAELPLVTPVIEEDNFTLSTTVVYESYQWLWNGELILEATESSYTATENGNYQVVVSNEYGCSDTSAIYAIDDITSIDGITNAAKAISLYPNPASGQVRIKAPHTVNVKISSISGKLIATYQQVSAFPIYSLTAGMYVVTISDADGSVLQVEKLIKIGR